MVWFTEILNLKIVSLIANFSYESSTLAFQNCHPSKRRAAYYLGRRTIWHLKSSYFKAAMKRTESHLTAGLPV